MKVYIIPIAILLGYSIFLDMGTGENSVKFLEIFPVSLLFSQQPVTLYPQQSEDTARNTSWACEPSQFRQKAPNRTQGEAG